MGNRVPPRRHSTIGFQEFAELGLELDSGSFYSNGLPPPERRLDHLATGGAEQEALVGGG
jgi:hypothetical protein